MCSDEHDPGIHRRTARGTATRPRLRFRARPATWEGHSLEDYLSQLITGFLAAPAWCTSAGVYDLGRCKERPTRFTTIALTPIATGPRGDLAST